MVKILLQSVGSAEGVCTSAGAEIWVSAVCVLEGYPSSPMTS